MQNKLTIKMSKSFQILLLCALFLEFSHSLSLLEAEKIPSNPREEESYYDEELSDFPETEIEEESKSDKEPTDILDIEIGVNLTSHENIIVGYNGTFVFETDYDDEGSDLFVAETIEKETSFSTIMSEDNNFTHILNTNCRLWKPSEKIKIICDANFFARGRHSVRIRNKSFLYRQEFPININFYGNLVFEQVDLYYPFLYSYKQKINIMESQSIYEIKFKFNTYYDEILYIYGTKDNYAVLDNCQKIGQELNCKVSKDKLEEILISKNEQFYLSSMSDTLGDYNFNYVYPITIDNENALKKDINVKLEKIVGRITELGTPFAIETNVSEIPNLISDSSNVIPNTTFYFKKMTGKPLMLFVEYSSEGENMPTPSFPNVLVLSAIHYKYNFIISPFESNETISIKNYGARVFLVYPEKIDLNSSNSTIIRYIMDNPHLSNEIKLNPDSKFNLECENINNMKKCIVSKSHFNWKKSGYYNIFHKNHEGDFNIYYETPLINATLAEKEAQLYIEYEDNKRVQYVGNYGVLNIVLDYNDKATNIFNESDIEEKTTFETKILFPKYNRYNVICKLWKPIDEKLNMFCKMDFYLSPDYYRIYIDTSSFYYNDRKFFIIQHTELSFYLLNYNIPFLYSGKQVLNIEEKTETYELKFKNHNYYFQEKLLMQGEDNAIIFLDNCSYIVNKSDISCKIGKDIIEEFATHNGQKFSISYFKPDYEGSLGYDSTIYSIYGIYINYPLSKKDIYVGITKLLENNIDYNNFIAYETNVKEIANVYSKRFILNLSDEKEKIVCSLKKTEVTSLLMICQVDKEQFSLGEIKKQVELRDINIKYNFFIQPIDNRENCTISGSGSYIEFAYPRVLNFIYNSQITIYYRFRNSYDSNNITLIPEENDIECTNINYEYKKCYVYKSYFREKESGYYYTYHKNHVGNYIKFYESSPFNVILPKTIYINATIKKELNKGRIKIGNKMVFALITDYNNKEKNYRIQSTSFVGTFIDTNHDKINANCRLWLPNVDNLRIICTFNNFYYHSLELYLEKIVVYSDNYKFTIDQDEPTEFVSNNYVPFIYSERQTINIFANRRYYELNFQVEEYSNDLLYIYGSNNNYAILDNCLKNYNYITCRLSREKVEEILVKNGEEFRIGAMNDNIGIILLEHVLNISFNYKYVQKEDIFLEIKEIVGETTEIDVPVGFVTNVTEIPNFISSKFEDKKYFKKISGRPLMLFYSYSSEGDYELKVDDSKETVLNNIHYKYNFRIQPSKYEGRISVRGYGTNILLTYPLEFNYTFSESFNIRYIMDEPELAKEMTLNSNSSNEINCTNLYKMKACTVSKYHFDRNKGGVYSTRRLNHMNESSIYYDSSPIKITLPFEINIYGKDNPNTIEIGYHGIIYLKSDYNDTDRNIFNDSNIEEKTKFTTKISYDYSYDYDISCHLWKNTEGIICIFCKLDKGLGYGYHYVRISGGGYLL